MRIRLRIRRYFSYTGYCLYIDAINLSNFCLIAEVKTCECVDFVVIA